MTTSHDYIISRTVIQTVNTQTGAVATGSTVMPYDDTIPQNTEGDEYMTLAITPTSATNKLLIEVTGYFTINFSAVMIGALFQDSTANALAACVHGNAGNGYDHPLIIRHFMTSGTTSSTTFKFRAGPSLTSKTVTFNGYATARKLGGVMASNITISEIRVP